MKTYTKEQIAKAMGKYTLNVLNNPDEFCDLGTKQDVSKTAQMQTDYLLSLVDPVERDLQSEYMDYLKMKIRNWNIVCVDFEEWCAVNKKA